MTKYRIPTPQEEEYILNLYTKEQLPIITIHKQTKFTVQRIKDILSRNNIEIRHQRTISESEALQMIEMYKNGVSSGEIAKILGFKGPSVLNILHQSGIKVNAKGKERLRNTLTEEQELQLCEDYKNLIPLHKLREKYNIGWRKVNHILDKHSIPRNSQGDYPNPMTGTFFYKIWVEKYGKEKADEMHAEVKARQSEKSSGKGNAMYGKPSPMKSGYGWKGWYKTHYFRSLREVCYMLFLDENNIKWESAEQGRFRIPYINWDGTERTYAPDIHLLESKTLVELKPERLVLRSPLVKLKAEAAREWADKNGYKYEIFDIKIEPEKILIQLESGNIKFAGNYELKFREYIAKN